MPEARPATLADELIGVLVDERYKVLESMASGSMGAVFKAERVPVGKLVAIKFLHAAFANDSEFLTRFERETRVMSKLAHPNCVSVVDFGVYEGSPYLVMDYVSGITLRALIDLGPLPPLRALAVARQITSGLAHAHAQGIVHRDIKPANIMISEEIGTGEHVRILDFGLARLRGAVGRDATQSNVVVGTPNYMAPEQTVGGGTIDARTDVYAVGVVLFEMVVGERPFQAEDTLALLGMHRAAPIPKLVDRMKNPRDLPEGLQHVIEKAMAKAPDDRYQSAIELAEAIDRLSKPVSSVDDPRAPTVVDKPRRLSKRSEAAAVAPTLQQQVDVDTAAIKVPKRGNSIVGIALAVIVLGGGAYAAWYYKNRGADPKVVATLPPIGGSSDTPAGDDAAPAITPPTADAAEVVAVLADAPDPTPIDAIDIDATAAVVAIADDAAAVEPGPGSSGDTAGSGSAADEIDMAPDPAKAENVAPTVTPHDDEVADAPKSTDDVEKHTPAVAVRATTIPDALQLIKDGKSDLAIASLRPLWKKVPRSAYIPFLLGNLYFDKGWWSVALDHYRSALAKNATYKKNQTLNLNIIRMLASKKTSGGAEYTLRKIGKPSVVYLRYAAQHDRNAYVRKYASALAKAIGGR
jgi:eukaryotic-like serine/threonine-protein kinase